MNQARSEEEGKKMRDRKDRGQKADGKKTSKKKKKKKKSYQSNYNKAYQDSAGYQIPKLVTT